MYTKLRANFEAFLSQHSTCVLTTSGQNGAWALPVSYRSQGLDIECLLPCWSDATFFLQQDTSVLLIIQSSPLCWLSVRGVADFVPQPQWEGLLPEGIQVGMADMLFQVVRVIPQRMDLIDQRRGWGIRETWESGASHSMSGFRQPPI